jgi:hypothetical protein
MTPASEAFEIVNDAILWDNSRGGKVGRRAGGSPLWLCESRIEVGASCQVQLRPRHDIRDAAARCSAQLAVMAVK